MTRRENPSKNADASSTGSGWSLQGAVRSARGSKAPPWSGKKHLNPDELPVSPGTVPPSGTNYFSIPPQSGPSNYRGPMTAPFRDPHRDLPGPDNFAGGIPSISREPPSAPLAQIAPWATEPVAMPSTAMLPPSRSFYNDSDDSPQPSPAFRPGTARTETSDSMDWHADNRRPSVASAGTSGSQDSSIRTGPSKSGFPRTPGGYFGEEHGGKGSMQGSETSLPSVIRTRTNSANNYDYRPGSPTSSRPRTPLPSSDVVPWVFQDFKDISQHGVAPIRQGLSDRDPQAYDAPNSAHHLGKFHFPHRHTRSKEETPRPSPREPTGFGLSPRPSTSRADSPNGGPRRMTDLSSSPYSPMRGQLSARATSPTPSSSGLANMRSPADPPSSAKRSLFDKIRRHKGTEKNGNESLKSLPGSTKSLQDPSGFNAKIVKLDPLPPRRGRDASIMTFDSGSTIKPIDTNQSEASSKKEGRSRLLHGHGKFSTPTRKGFGLDAGKDGDPSRNDSPANESFWNLDTDLSHMEGILSAPPPETPMNGGPYTGMSMSDDQRREAWELNATTGPGAWDAPDSWAVKKVADDNMDRLREVGEDGVLPMEEDTGVPHCVRIFRVDSTFATLSTSVNTTVTEILQILGKKSFLQDDLHNYQIIMKKHDLQKQLKPAERPLVVQKKLLEQAGYQASDRIEEIGREDNTYLCRFTFVPTKISGYYSLDKDAGVGKMAKFSHVDLTGRSLVTIPIVLYKKGSEIISLNLSRNLSLDVPKDFIQGCTNLREVKYTGNEAYRLPESFSLASRLTVLDISNNCFESLDHASLHKLQGLVSIKLSNNKLTSLPSSFSQFRSLRSLNLSSNYLKVFPDFLCDLKTLVDLDVSFNEIESLPRIGQLVTLERLWATNNKLTGSFADDFKLLENLKEVDVRFNGLNSMDVISQLPKLEQLFIGHNAISKFEGTFARLRTLQIDHNPITRFDFEDSIPTLTYLNLASNQIAQLDDSFYERIPNLTKLKLDKNHFAELSKQIGRLSKLEYLSASKTRLMTLPPTIGCLHELRYLDLHECNIKILPTEMWCCIRLDTLNLSSNVLESFPKLTPNLQVPTVEASHTTSNPTPPHSISIPTSPSHELGFAIEELGHRRPSQASTGLLSVGSSPVASTRKNSLVSVYGPGGRKASVISRTPTEITLPTLATVTTASTMPPLTRKDSNIATRLTSTFAGSIRQLYIADNRLGDDTFDMITLCPELRVLNMSYNELDDFPQNALRKWPNLQELYLSGNDLTSLPTDDLLDNSNLKVLHLNGNKFQVLPAELGKVSKLAILDVGSNLLKYNVSNWPYDWNWNWNPNLKYLNFSGNKRLEIKPNQSPSLGSGQRDGIDYTNFTRLQHLRVLGLMDVTLTIPSVPEQTEDRRIRTSGSIAGSLSYGMADYLGRHEHLSIIDMLVPRFRTDETKMLAGMFDGQALSSGGSKVAKFLAENFTPRFNEELDMLREEETPSDALRRTFLALNKDLATAASQSLNEKEHRTPQNAHRGSVAARTLSAEDLNSGGVATILYLDNTELFIANIGDAQAMLIQNDGAQRVLTTKHSPADSKERERIRAAGGYVSRHGKLNDLLEVSRAFGYIQLMPAVMAAPSIMQITLKESDEMIILASRELWDYLTPDIVVDMARSERSDLMRAAQKLRDLAIAFGATGKIMVMIFGVNDLKKRDRSRNRGNTLSMGPSQQQDDRIFSSKRGKRGRDALPDDSTLARLDNEIRPPTGELAMVFTDIKSSTALWEAAPVAMRASIKIHNDLLRRQLRIVGGYEVKTEGDAFMVSFPTVTSALLWCFSVQNLLMDAPWPNEILESVHGQEVVDSDGNRIYRGLSVRMGIHWGAPVCELDPVTKRMDYFGPMVNRASRISAIADGGQITVSSDFIAEIERTLETYAESDRSGSTGSEDTMMDDAMAQQIRRDLRALGSQGFEVKDLGETKLKGLENPEFIFLMYPHVLAGRLIAQQLRIDAEAAAASSSPASVGVNSELGMEAQSLWDLWNCSLKLEMLCSALESTEMGVIHAPETAVLERMKNRGGEVTDRFLVQFMEHLVSRVETCVATLTVRHMVRPFQRGQNLLAQAAPIGDILGELAEQLAELKSYREEQGMILGPA